MTEYELVDTFYTIATFADQLIASFITFLFAFLIASYLVSAKLDSRMVVIVIALYSFMALRYVLIYYNATGDMIPLADTLMELRIRGDSSLDWLEIGGGMQMMHIGTSLAMFLSFAASILFFFFMRHRGDQ